MEDRRVTAEQILSEIGIDIERMAQKVADAINNAQPGAIIDQSEERFETRMPNFGKKPTRNPSACWKKTSRLFPPRHLT